MILFHRGLRCIRMTMTCCSVAVLGGVLSACAAKPSLYRWGAYEDIVYARYADAFAGAGASAGAGSDDAAATAAALLEQDLARTLEEGKRAPPGVRAHLGYLYFEQGRLAEARALLEEERSTYPESTLFIDRLLSRMNLS